MLIAIEGIDGSGKGTQASLLVDQLRGHGYSAPLIEFPRYAETFFGQAVACYLNGEFGDLMQVHPKLGALLYAGDRFETREELLDHVGRGTVVVCDRYTPSNQAHHAAKLPSDRWSEFFDWVDHLEHEVFSVPRPDAVIFLDVDAVVSATLVRKKPQRSYTTLRADIHEVDELYQENVFRAYQVLVSRSDWITVDCMNHGTLKTPGEIADLIWKSVETLLVGSSRVTHLRQ